MLPAPYEMQGMIVVNTERKTPAVWGAVGVTTRGHAVRKELSNLKPQHMYHQRSPGLPGMSDRRWSTAMISACTSDLFVVVVVVVLTLTL